MKTQYTTVVSFINKNIFYFYIFYKFSLHHHHHHHHHQRQDQQGQVKQQLNHTVVQMK